MNAIMLLLPLLLFKWIIFWLINYNINLSAMNLYY